MNHATEGQNAIQSLNDSTQLLTNYTRLGREISIGRGLASMARTGASLGGRKINSLLSREIFTTHQPLEVFDNPLVGLAPEVQDELKTLNNLVLYVLKNPDKTKNFRHGNDILEAESALERLVQGLQELDALLEAGTFTGEDKNRMLQVKEDVETAILIVSQNLFEERLKRDASSAVETYSTIANVLGCLAAGGANLAPQFVKTIASICSKGCDIALRELESTESDYRIHQPSEIFDNPLTVAGLDPEMRDRLKTSNDLVLDVLRNPDKTKNFRHGNYILGAEPALERLVLGLEWVDALLEADVFTEANRDKMLLVRKDMETAILIMSQNVSRERLERGASCASATYSTAANVLGCLAAGGANLAPQLVKTIASIYSKGCDIALMGLESSRSDRRIRQTLGILDGTLEEVRKSGLRFSTDLDFKFIRAHDNLALSVFRDESLEMGERKLRKEAARENLWQALERIDELIRTGKVTDTTANGELKRIKDDIGTALEILDMELAARPTKITGAGLSVVASTVATATAICTGTPIGAASALYSLYSSISGFIKTAREVIG